MKKSFVIPAVAVVFAVVALCLWYWGLPVYRRFREQESVTKARQFLNQRQYREASLSARQALQFNPRNLEANRMMAELAAMGCVPQELDWRKRVAELAPTVESKLALAAATLRLEPPPFRLAGRALQELEPAAGALPAFQVTSAELALRLNRKEEAFARLEEACRLEPTNELYRLNLAVFQLGSSNTVAAAHARETLEAPQQNTNLAPVALRWLTVDAMRREQTAEARRYSSLLLAMPHPRFDDRLQYAAILRVLGDDQFSASLAALQREAATNAVLASATALWMIRQALAEDASQWLSNCPPEIQAQPPVPAALAECFMARKDWLGLETYLAPQKWGEADFLRLAFLSEAARQRNQVLAAENRWRTALREAGDRWGSLTALMNLADKWERREAKEELLWQIVRKFPRERWALKELEHLCTVSDDTLGLNKVYSTMAAQEPDNFAVKNNLAATSLLLKIGLTRAHVLAREAYSEHPDNAAVAATFAFSLQEQGKTADAVAVFQKLPPRALDSPQVALYYGLALACSGDTNNAAKYLAKGATAKLLPEEKQLLAAALAATK